MQSPTNTSQARSNKYASHFFRLMQTMEPSVCYNIRFGTCTTFIQFSKSRILTITRDNTLEYKNHKFSPFREYVAVIQFLADIIYHKQRTDKEIDIEHILKNFQLYAEPFSLYRMEMTKLTLPIRTS